MINFDTLTHDQAGSSPCFMEITCSLCPQNVKIWKSSNNINQYTWEIILSADLYSISVLAVMTQKNYINLPSPQANTRWWVASCLQLATAMESKAWYWLSTVLLWQNWHSRAPTGSELMNGRASSQTGRRRWSPWGMKDVYCHTEVQIALFV